MSNFLIKLRFRLFLILSCFLLGHADCAFANATSCTVPSATAKLWSANLENEAKVSNALKPELAELANIDNSAKNDKEPIVNQITKKQAVEFEKIRTEIMHYYLFELTVSARSRDASVLNEMYNAMIKNPDLDVKHFNNIGQAVLAVARVHVKGDLNRTVFVKSKDKCTVMNALYQLQYAADSRIRNGKISRIVVNADAYLKKKYGLDKTGKINTSTMSPSDKIIFENVNKLVPTYLQELNFDTDVRAMILWWKISRFVYHARQQDLFAGLQFGSTATQMKIHLNQRQRFMLKIWKAVNEKDPSDEQKDLSQAASIVKLINKTK